jgi:ParB family transcriptional regulator, chromosome partitioning protein
MSHGRLESVRTSAVEVSATRFKITTDEGIDVLVASIRRIGLLNPPVLFRQGPGHVIVSGFRRVDALNSLKTDRFSARVLDPETDPVRCAAIAIADNAFQRSLNIIELARAYTLLEKTCSDRDQLLRTAAAAGLAASPSLIERLLPVCRLHGAIQSALIADTVSLPVALELGRLPEAVGIALAQIFIDLKLGLNRQREILTLVKEIARREGIDMLAVLGSREMEAILNGEPDRGLKRQHLRRYLLRRRFPAITEAEESFARLTRDLRLGKHAALIPPKNFEGNTYQMQLFFKTPDELRGHADRLHALAENPLLEKILRKE